MTQISSFPSVQIKQNLEKGIELLKLWVTPPDDLTLIILRRISQRKASQKAKPDMEDGGEKAVYKDLKIKGGDAAFGMIKSGKYWYISGESKKLACGK